MNKPPAADCVSAYRIASYNVRYFGHALHGLASTRKSQQGIAAELAALAPRPHIICLQEVETRSLRSTLAHPVRSKKSTQLENFMAEFEAEFKRNDCACPYEAYYFRAHTYRLTRKLNVYTTGLAILVDRTAFQVEAHNVTAPQLVTHPAISRVKDSKQTRICAHIRLLAPGGQPLHIFNTHLSLPSPFRAAFWAKREKLGFGGNQLAEAKTLMAFIRRSAGDDPFAVCGDFNSPPGSPVYRYLTGEAGLTAAQAALGQSDEQQPRAFPTAGFLGLRMHLDHLFSGGGVVWTDLAGTCPFGDHDNPFHGLSDHVPLLAGFRLGG